VEPPETYAGADGTTEEEGGEMLGENIGWCRLVSFQPFHFQEIISCKVAEKKRRDENLARAHLEFGSKGRPRLLKPWILHEQNVM